MMRDLLTLRAPEPRTTEEWLTFFRNAREHTLQIDEVFRREFGGAACRPIVSMPTAALDPLIEQLERLQHSRQLLAEAEQVTTDARQLVESERRETRRAKATAVIAIVVGLACAAASWMVVAFS